MSERFLEDYAVGQRFASGRVRVELAALKAFAREFDPQPFHLDEEAARASLFGGLAASGWHTAALTMRLLVDGDFRPAGGLIGAGFDELAWPLPVRAGDELRVASEVIDIRRSKSRPERGMMKVRNVTFNQHDQAVMVQVVNLVVPSRPQPQA
jgi:acyl dehydratase